MNVKSCEKTNTLRPSIVPQPVTTPSPYTRRFSMPNPRARDDREHVELLEGARVEQHDHTVREP